MKIKRLLIAVAIILSALSIQAQAQIFEKLSNNKEITTVIVSKSMLSMVEGLDIDAINIKALSDKLEGIEIYNGESKSAISLMKSETNKLAKDKSYELLMTLKEDDENISFYGKKESGGKFKDFIMCIDESDEFSIIRIVGSFSADDIQGIVQDVM